MIILSISFVLFSAILSYDVFTTYHDQSNSVVLANDTGRRDKDSMTTILT